MKALIDPRQNLVVQVETDEFPVAPPLRWEDTPVGVDVKPGWEFRGNTFFPPTPPTPIPPGPTPSELEDGNGGISRAEMNNLKSYLRTRFGF